MFQGVASADAFRRIVGQESANERSTNVIVIIIVRDKVLLVQQIETFLGERGVESRSQAIVRIEREIHFLRERQRIVFGPNLLVRRAQIFENPIQLIQFGFTGKERFHQQQFPEDGSDTPNVDGTRIFLNEDEEKLEESIDEESNAL